VVDDHLMRIPPICKNPVGEGANLTLTVIVIGIL